MKRVLSAILCAAAISVSAAADQPYAYATNGVLDKIETRSTTKWKLLLNESNLGGKELEAAELILPAGTTVRGHVHGSLEVIYVLAGTYQHEVNGKLYELKPGMIGIVRPGDTVRHLVPKDSGDAKLLVLWAPGGEFARGNPNPKGVTPDPVPEVKKSEP